VDAENLTYRVRLLDTFVKLIGEKPFFGAYDFMLRPEMQDLRTGEGIIDVVNTYVGIGFSSGLVGLSIFVGLFVTIAVGILRAAGRARHDADANLLGQALLATLLGILVMISAVASITVIPVIYWAVAGLGVGYARMAENLAADTATAGIARSSAAGRHRNLRPRPAHQP
jgi:O-antigen ligase